MKKKTRSDKSLFQQRDDLAKCIAKHGDPNNTRVRRLDDLNRMIDLNYDCSMLPGNGV